MGMSIEQIIKYLPAPICGDTVIGEEKQKEYDAHDTAVIILRKYQKIVDIVSLNGEEFKQCGLKELKEILEVIADGNEK